MEFIKLTFLCQLLPKRFHLLLDIWELASIIQINLMPIYLNID